MSRAAEMSGPVKSLWNILSFLAVVNLLALAIFIAWLWQSDRLSASRVQQLRDMLSVTIAEEKARDDESQKKAKAQAEAELEQQVQANPPIESGAQLQQISLIKHEQEQARRRLEDERDVLLSALEAESKRLERKRQELDQQKAAWENAVRDERQRKNDEQFLQAVRQLEQLSPKQGKQMIVELVEKKQSETAVAYLDAMSPRSSAKILKEFKSETEIELATELLEQLRTFGLKSSAAAPAAAANGSASPTQEAPNANDRASAPSIQ